MSLAEIRDQLQDAKDSIRAIEAVLAAAEVSSSAAAKEAQRTAAELASARAALHTAEERYTKDPAARAHGVAVGEAMTELRLVELRANKAHEVSTNAAHAVDAARTALDGAKKDVARLARDVAIHHEAILARVEPHCARILDAIEVLVSASSEIDAIFTELEAVSGWDRRPDREHLALLPLLEELAARGRSLHQTEEMGLQTLLSRDRGGLRKGVHELVRIVASDGAGAGGSLPVEAFQKRLNRIRRLGSGSLAMVEEEQEARAARDKQKRLDQEYAERQANAPRWPAPIAAIARRLGGG